MQKVMEKAPAPIAAYLALMGLSAIVCVVVAGNAAYDALALLKSVQATSTPNHAKACEGVLTLVAAGIFGCLSYCCAKNFRQALKK